MKDGHKSKENKNTNHQPEEHKMTQNFVFSPSLGIRCFFSFSSCSKLFFSCFFFCFFSSPLGILFFFLGRVWGEVEACDDK